MVNLGYGSSIVATELSDGTYLFSLHLEGAHDKGDAKPYYHATVTDIAVILNREQWADLQREVLPVPRGDAPGLSVLNEPGEGK